ncbi:MAG: hypothetical protein NWS86_10270, partial [Flavobacteriales bacterium]|nr:hypothetical protein [Flavobacteriales bacterium]
MRSFAPSLKTSPKPTLPGIRRRPKLPKEIDDSKYEVEFAWYEIFGRKKKIAQIQAVKERAYLRYDRSMAKYETKLEKYIADSIAQPEKHKAYQEALAAWKTQVTADSLYFNENVYKPFVKKREENLAILYARYDAEMVAWR